MILSTLLSGLLNAFVGRKAVIGYLNADCLVYAVFIVVTTCKSICIYVDIL